MENNHWVLLYKVNVHQICSIFFHILQTLSNKTLSVEEAGQKKNHTVEDKPNGKFTWTQRFGENQRIK